MNDNRLWVDSVWEKLEQKVSRTAVENRYKIPYTTKDGIYDDYSEGQKITWWTNGFWGGLMWLMYSETQKECYKTTAEISEEKLDGAFRYPRKGTPQGGIISPLLANIVLNELDHWVESQWQEHPLVRQYAVSINHNGSENKSAGYHAMKKTGLKEMFIVR